MKIPFLKNDNLQNPPLAGWWTSSSVRELRWQPPFNENYQHYLDPLESLNQRIHDHLIWLELKAHATVLIPMSFLSFLNHPHVDGESYLYCICRPKYFRWYFVLLQNISNISKISQVIFRLSLALLLRARSELLHHDMEGVLTYFQVVIILILMLNIFKILIIFITIFVNHWPCKIHHDKEGVLTNFQVVVVLLWIFL